MYFPERAPVVAQLDRAEATTGLALVLVFVVVAVTAVILARQRHRKETSADERHRQRLEDTVERETALLLRYRLALEAGRLAVWDWDIGENVTVRSDIIDELYGLRPGTLSDRDDGPYYDYTHPEDRADIEERTRAALAGEWDYDTEYRILWPDGEVRFMRDVGEVLRDPEGEPVRMIGVTMDVTRRRRAESALRESERRYRRLIEQVPCVTYSVAATADSPSLFISPQMEQLSGRRPEEYYADSSLWERNVLPEHRGVVVERWRSCVEDGGGFSAEYRVRRADGSTVWVRDEAVLVEDEDGRPRYLQGILLDITDEKRAQQMLVAQAARDAALAELGQLALTGVPLSELFETATKMVASALEPDVCAVMELRADGDTLVVRSLWGPQTPLEAQALRVHADSDLARALRSADPVVVTDIDRDGRLTSPASWDDPRSRRAVLVRIEGRARPFGLLTAHAASPEAFTQEDASFLRAVAHVMASAIGRREAEEQLLQAQKMEAVGRLASGIAHDFNNVMTAIIGYTELLRSTADEGSSARAHLDEIHSAGERATSMIGHLLSWSRAEVTAPEIVDLNRLVVSLQGMLRRLIDERIELRTSLSEPLGTVLVDPRRLEQVLLNLVVNAGDAMARGGTLTISTSNVDLGEEPGASASSLVRLSVADSGTGMDAATAAQAFEPFFTTKEERKGTGLGLSTVYGIVTAAGGSVTLDTEPGHGTTVVVDLPRADSQTVSERAARPVSTSAAHGGEHVLLVEDQDAVRNLVSEVLRQHGYRVSEAVNGAEGLDAVRSGRVRPDLLLTDVVMPRLGGTDLAARLREHTPELPVLYISGYSERPAPPADRITAFLRKPFGAAALVERVRDLLDA